jgi:hypothetical protein
MVVLSNLEREKRSFKRHPIRSTVLWLVVLSWAACVIWMIIATPTGMASTLFGIPNPSFWQTMAARALAGCPLVLLALWILIYTPFRLAEKKRNPPKTTEFEKRLHRGMGSPQLDDPDHAANVSNSDQEQN